MYAPTFSFPYFSGRVVQSSEVPGRYHVAVGGRPYLIDIESNEWKHQTVPLLRQQADQSASPGQNSLNPEGLWRRPFDSYHLGAGQTHRDNYPESSDYRFRASKGVNVWNRWRLSLLPDTDEKRASANANLGLTTVGSRVYLIDGTAVIYTDNITADAPTWTAATGGPGTTLAGITSDGTNVYLTDGANVFRFIGGGIAAVGAAWNTLDCDLLDYVKGRVMAAHDHEIFNITSATPPTALLSHPNTAFRWVAFAEGTNCIYAAGFAGDKSEIYRTTVTATGSSLDAPIIAGRLPDGEIVRSIAGYLGFVLIGTDRGVRLASPNGDGDLTIGALLDTDSACRCFEPQGPYVWFGWDTYDATSTGLGRISLENFAIEGALAPAYASDLMVTHQGNVTSIVTASNLTVFTVAGSGVYAEHTNLVPEGTLESGSIDFGLADEKIAIEIAGHHVSNAGSHTIELKGSDTDYEVIGTHSAAELPGAMSVASHLRSRSFEMRFTLRREESAPTTGPILDRGALLVQPAPVATTLLTVPVLLHSVDNLPAGTEVARDPAFELEHLKGLQSSRSVTAYQEGGTAYTVVVDDIEWRPYKFDYSQRSVEGTCVLHMKEL